MSVGRRSKPFLSKRDENHYEGKYRDEARLLGLMMRKVENLAEAGWPDNFMPPNVWLEFKHIRWTSNRPLDVWGHFSAQQIVMMRDLNKRGADCYVVIFWDMEDAGEFVQTARFAWAIDRGMWLKQRDVMPFVRPLSEIRDHVRELWGMGQENGVYRLRRPSETQEEPPVSRHPAGRGPSRVVKRG